MNKIFKYIKKEILEREEVLSEFACKSKNAILLREDNTIKENEFRPAFAKDTDRIIHSKSYTRYIDKTQVYSFIENDHITHRVLHVQLVSKIARTIGQSLNLNQDLIEAIALGHDVGHAPFGHAGERFLNEICIKEEIGCFCHNAQSVRALKNIENINITLQTLDGILAHNGEILQYEYKPKNKSKEQFLKELEDCFKDENASRKIAPMTLEGCVVRISDVIAYIGRDIEDAITVGTINREDIPNDITKVLGSNNSSIVDNLIKDIIINSMGKGYISFSKEIYNALMNLKEWNYKNIYESEEACKNYLTYMENSDKTTSDSKERILEFINQRSKEYKENTSKKRMVIDYMAGQTDSFFLRECKCNFKEFNKEKLYK